MINLIIKNQHFIYSSTCHGAGRALSRAKSRRNIDYQEVLDKMQAQGISIRVASPKLVIFIYLSGIYLKWVLNKVAVTVLIYAIAVADTQHSLIL